MTVLLADLLAAYPGRFDSIAEGAVNAALVRARLVTPEAIWEDAWDAGVLLMTAHMLTTEFLNAAAIAGATSYSAGPVSMSFGGGGVASGLGATTSYLAQYNALKAGLCRGPVIP